jgi:Family of unknown function (DUF5829)
MRKSFLFGAMTLMIASLISSRANPKLPAISLNHFYVVVDSATYKAIEQSPFLRKEFAVSEQRTTTRTDITYTGVYFYGTNTYFEFFDAANTAMGKQTDSGIAFGVDQPGGVEVIKTELASDFFVREPITRGFEGKQVPWFYMGVPSKFSNDSGLRFWIMEYHPRFLAEWNPTGKDQGISRRDILARYAAVLKDSPSKPYLKDVIAITMAVDESTHKRFVELGKGLGLTARPDGTTTILKGHDFELRIVPQTTAARGFQQITLRVTGKPDKQTEFRFGERSILRFQGNGLATWTF